jgi:PAS domain-containing protein
MRDELIRSDTQTKSEAEPSVEKDEQELALVQRMLLGEAADGADIGIAIATRDRCVAINQYGAEALGYSREELLTKKPQDLTAMTDSEVATIVQELQSHGAATGVTALVKSSGASVQVHFEAFVLGQPAVVLGIWRPAETARVAEAEGRIRASREFPTIAKVLSDLSDSSTSS